VLCLARSSSLDVSTGRREFRNVLYRSDCSVKEKDSILVSVKGFARVGLTRIAKLDLDLIPQ
jgi:hypothetical protein